MTPCFLHFGASSHPYIPLSFRRNDFSTCINMLYILQTATWCTTQHPGELACKCVYTPEKVYYSIVYAIDFPLAYSIIWVFVLFRFIDLDWNETVRKRKWQGKIKSTHDVKMEQWTEGSGRKRENTGFYVKTEQQCFPQHYNNRVLRPDWKIPKMGVHNYCACVKCN